MKNTYHLLRTAKRLANKYAQSQTLEQILENAASSGEKSVNGIMNFPAQLKKDQATLSFTVDIGSKTMGGFEVEVSPPIVNPPEFAAHYAKLPEQIKKYLDRNINGFPQIQNQMVTLRYTGATAESGIAYK